MKRLPSEVLVVDTNIVISTVLGFRSRSAWGRVSAVRKLIMSAEAASEVIAVAAHVRSQASGAVNDAVALIEAINLIPPRQYAAYTPTAERALLHAPASRNGSITDAHILALAWTYDADIWSHDRDFAGTGWPSWSSANLAEALSEEAAASAAKTI